MIPFVFFLLVAAQEQKPAEPCARAGTVVDSVTGTALGKVLVVAESSNNEEPLPAAETDAKGRFTLVNVKAGSYRLKGSRNGYLDTYYGAERSGNKGISLTLAPGDESKALQMKLIPFAVIAGTVRDPEGEALADARVALISLRYRNGVRVARASGEYASMDDLGQFRITGVQPGRYYVRAVQQRNDESRPIVNHAPKDAPPPQVLLPTFHPSSRELAGARAIEVGAGERITGADVTLDRSRLFRVSVTVEGPPGLDSSLGLDERPNLNDVLASRPVSTCKDNRCEFRAVPAGAYSAVGTAEAKNRTMTLQDLFSNNGRYRASVPVDVINRDVDGILVTISGGAEVAGHVSVEGDAPADLSEAAVIFVDEDGEEHIGSASKDGAFTCLLQLGRYEVQAHGGKSLIAKSIRAGDADLPAEGLMISRPGKLAMEVVLSRDGAAMEGVVQDESDKPIPGATVVLIPEAKFRLHHDLYQDETTDQYGHFQFDSIPPGEYKLFAWSNVEEGIWFDPEFLKDVEANGKAITVQAKGHETTKLRLLPTAK